MLVAASHLVIGLIGAVLLYVALFLRETEEGKLQNRLEKLWVEIDDLSKAALSRQTAFLQRIAAMATSGLNRLFGARLLSAGAAAASLSFSLGSIFLFRVYAFEFFAHDWDQDELLMFLVVGIVCFVVGLLPVPFRYLAFLWFIGGIFVALYYNEEKELPMVVLEVWLLLFGGFVSDVLFIAMSRWCLRRSSELKNGWKIASLLILNGCGGLALVSPLFWGVKAEINTREVSWLGLFGASNLVTGAISLLFVVLAIIGLLHLAVWPILERPVYSLQRFGVARSPKLLAATSVTCLMFAWPHSPIIQAITKLVHG